MQNASSTLCVRPSSTYATCATCGSGFLKLPWNPTPSAMLHSSCPTRMTFGHQFIVTSIPSCNWSLPLPGMTYVSTQWGEPQLVKRSFLRLHNSLHSKLHKNSCVLSLLFVVSYANSLQFTALEYPSSAGVAKFMKSESTRIVLRGATIFTGQMGWEIDAFFCSEHCLVPIRNLLENLETKNCLFCYANNVYMFFERCTYCVYVHRM